MCGVAGASLNQVDAATSYISNNTLLTAPSMGKPAILIAIVAALITEHSSMLYCDCGEATSDKMPTHCRQ